MPSGSYIVTGAICGFIAVVAMFSGNAGVALLFAIGVGTNRMLYKRAMARESAESSPDVERKETRWDQHRRNR